MDNHAAHQDTSTVFVVGSMNIDVTTRTERLPRPGETVLGLGHAFQCGGKGANQAVAAARCGATVQMVGCMGHDRWGQVILETLTTEGIGIAGVQRVPEHSGLASITVDRKGENVIVVSPAANAQTSESVVTQGLAALRAGDLVVTQAEIPPHTVSTAAQIARERGARFVLNLAPVVPLPEAMPKPDVLVVNEHEAQQLLGSTDSEPDALIRRLSDFGKCVVLTLGERGALLLDGERVHTVRSPVPEEVVDTTGAGDAFVGGLAAALARGAGISEAVQWAAAAGSLAVQGQGAQGGPLTQTALRDRLTQESRRK